MGNSKEENINSSEIDLKEMLLTILEYKYSILFIMFLSVVGISIYLYLTPSIYSSNATVEFIGTQKAPLSNDMLMEAFDGGGGTNLDTEIEVLKSRYMTNRILDYLDLEKQYYIKKNYKKIELYENLPFVVNIKYINKIDFNFQDMKFTIFPEDDDNFVLKFRTTFKKESKISKISKIIKKLLNKKKESDYSDRYIKTHKYGKEITTKWFSFTIEKKLQLKKVEYSFVIHTDKQLLIKKIQRGLKISQINKNASILNISYQDNIAIRAKKIVNSLVKAYMKEQLDRNKKDAGKSLKFINEQLTLINKNLKISAEKLEKYKKNNAIVNINASATATLAKLTEYETKISKVELELNIFSTLNYSLKSGKELVGISMMALQQPTPILSSMLQSLQKKQVEIKSLMIEFTPAHPQVIKQQNQINILKENIKKSIKNIINNLKSKKRSLNKIIKKYQKSLSLLPEKEIKLANLQRGFLINEKIYSYLLQKQTEKGIIKASAVSNAKILDEAIVTNSPAKPKRALIIVITIIAGLIIGILVAFVRDLFNNKIQNRKDLERLTKITIYGSVPFCKNEKQRPHFIEAFRVIRRNLEFLDIKNRAKIITITSSISQEGKTTIIANIGKILAQGFRKTILIDLDMRKAKLGKELGIENMKGCSNYLMDEIGLDEIIAKTEEPNLDIIIAGMAPQNPSELLMNRKIDKLLKVLSKRYDYILVDTPPIELISDAVLMMKKSDFSLVTVKTNFSYKELILNINTITKENKIKSIGIILNGVPITQKSYI